MIFFMWFRQKQPIVIRFFKAKASYGFSEEQDGIQILILG